MENYIGVLKKYAVFEGRARRKEYWMFFLFNSVFLIGLGIIGNFLSSNYGIPGILHSIYALAVFIPFLAVSVRRLHDIGKSGWWLLITLIPLLGGLIILLFDIRDSMPGDNQYGPNPKGVPVNPTTATI